MRRALLVGASLTHVGPLANNLRAIDRLECEALGRKPKEALRLALRTSLHALTALDASGRPICMFGVCPAGLLTGNGVPWLLATDALFDHATDLMRAGPKVLRWWFETFDRLENIISVENARAIALLRHWGAEIGTDVQTLRGVEFVTFIFSAAIQGGSSGE